MRKARENMPAGLLLFLTVFLLGGGGSHLTASAAKGKLNYDTVTLRVGNTLRLKETGTGKDRNRTITCSSSNKRVASVTKKGKIKAKRVGTATITATSSGGKKAVRQVKVREAKVTAPVISGLSAAKKTDKIIVVSSTSSTTSNATLQYFQKKTDGRWKKKLSADAYVGRNGIDKIKEGDKKTPTGLYHFSMLMGIASNPGTILPYHRIDSNDYWCGGPNYYNQFVDEDVQAHACSKTNDEHLIEYTNSYRYVAALDYNPDNVYGKGSAIFLHCNGNNPYTAGCISVEESVMKELIRIIDSDTVIIIDQVGNINNRNY